MRVAEPHEIDHAAAEEASPAAGAILGANPFVGIDASDVISTLSQFVASLAARPFEVTSRFAQLWTELSKIAAGVSNLEPDPTDKRFIDPTWADNPIYHSVMQSYLAWRAAMLDLAGAATDGESDWKTAARQRFVVTLLTEALSPTNALIGNPGALKRAFETGGQSLVRGFRNFIDDLWNNRGMPSQVDKRPFKVGGNIAATPGAVVHRSDLCEILQYTPATGQVYERPVLLVPPQINKYYVMDLSPKRSLTEYAVAHGVQFFTISWRNPGPEYRNCGLDDYVGMIKEAIEVVCNITGRPDLNLLALCAGGITSSLLLGHLAAVGDQRVHSATLLVTMLDSSAPSMTAMFASEDAIKAACARSQEKGVLDAASIARIFAWLRPNDLVWHYWVNNYLMGKDPAAFDILFWNADSTNLPAKLHVGFLDILLRNPLVEANKLDILGTPINLRNVRSDMYILAGVTDHICAWRACHHAARLFGGHTEFVLNSSGHVQSLVCPPGNFKAKYFTNARLGTDPDAWYRGATEHKGTWWDHWLEWVERRSGEKRAAPEVLGSALYAPIEAAPGNYVFQYP
jgi:polyhydroxyalkanoate synthase